MDIKIPFLGDGIESANVISVLVNVGDTVEIDDTLFELETDKATAPVPATVGGTIESIIAKEGDVVKEGTVVAKVTQSAGSEPAASEPAPAVAQPVQAVAPVAATVVSPQATVVQKDYQVAGDIQSVNAAPSIKKFAYLSNLDLARIQGTGSGGRVTWDDVKQYVSFLQATAFEQSEAVAATPAKPAPKKIDFEKFGSVTREPISSLRGKIADHLSNAWQTIPHVTQFGDINITPLMEIRKKTNAKLKKGDVKLTVTIFVMKAIVETLKEFPTFNASLGENELILKHYFHMGVAVDTDAGLVVPVIKDIDKKSLQETAKELDSLAENARNKALAVADIQGASFTLSNLGGLGASHFTPIVNDPEVAILGTGRAMPRVILDEKTNKVSNALMMPVALSYDHRVIDGADGARFMQALTNNIENFNEKWAK